jgi:hypothetical protein
MRQLGSALYISFDPLIYNANWGLARAHPQPTGLLACVDHHQELSPKRFVTLRESNAEPHVATIIEKDGGGGGGNAVIGFILGAVLLAVGIVGFFMWDSYKSGGAPKAIVVTGQHK